MSAIAGIFNFDGRPVLPDRLERLTAAMLTHGPDATHHYRAGAVALGHCLLSSRLTDTVQQPLVGASGNLAIVFDGRLDNPRELAARLALEPASISDAELVLSAYREWGHDCLERLDGDYVFALWNAREHCLLLAKDRVGARQLYYTTTGNFFAFASFDEALLALPGVSREPCGEMIAAFLVPEFEGYQNEHTWLEAVRALKPAHSLRVSRTGVSTQHRYWSFEPAEERRYASDAECGEAFVEVFEAAVAKRTRGIAEPALLVSGGIDSASVLATLAAVTPDTGRPLHAFSALLEPVETSPESRSIVSLTANPRIRSHVLGIPAFSGPVGADDLMDMVWARAHPVDNALLLPAMLCLAAQRAGHRSLLHGASGDVLLTGPHNYIAPLIRAGHLRTAWRECRAASEHHTYLQGAPSWALLLRSGWSAFAPASLKKLVRNFRSREPGPPPETSWVHPEFARRVRLAEGIEAARSRRIDQSLAPHRATHARNIFDFPGVSSGLAGFQRVGSLRGIEMLDPWADLTVIEFVLHLPLSDLVRDGWNKWPARSWLLGRVSPEVRWRSDKEHFGWLLTEHAMAASKSIIDDSLAAPGKLAEFVNLSVLRSKFESSGSTHEGLSDHGVYDTLTLIHWLRRLSDIGSAADNR